MKFLKHYTIKTYHETETMELANQLGQKLQAGDVVTLAGDLGAGKTTFTKGLATGLGIKYNITSPTFTIIKEYPGKIPLYHMDAYRLEHSDEDIGFEEYFYGNGVCVIEWAEFIKDLLPRHRLRIDIRRQDETNRLLTFTADNPYYEGLLEHFTAKKGKAT